MSKNVVIILANLLENRNIDGENPILKSLNDVERLFIFLFLLRKKKAHKNWSLLKISHIRDIELEYFISNFQDFTSVKRFEEEFKFLFKHAIQYFKKELEMNQIIPVHKKDTFVYKYYFDDISKANNVPLECFMDPSIIRKKKTKQIKTFGLRYLKIILTSKKFKNDFIKCILNKIEEIYIKKIEHKLSALLLWLSDRLNNYNEDNYDKNYGKSINKSGFDEEYIRKHNILTDYLVFNNQCKLPWSLSEIKIAKIRVIKKIEKLCGDM